MTTLLTFLFAAAVPAAAPPRYVARVEVHTYAKGEPRPVSDAVPWLRWLDPLYTLKSDARTGELLASTRLPDVPLAEGRSASCPLPDVVVTDGGRTVRYQPTQPVPRALGLSSKLTLLPRTGSRGVIRLNVTTAAVVRYPGAGEGGKDSGKFSGKMIWTTVEPGEQDWTELVAEEQGTTTWLTLTLTEAPLLGWVALAAAELRAALLSLSGG